MKKQSPPEPTENSEEGQERKKRLAKLAARMRVWREKNLPRSRELCRQSWGRHKEKYKPATRLWAQANRDSINEKARESYHKNRERRLLLKKMGYIRNKAQRISESRRYKKENPDIGKKSVAKYYARRRKDADFSINSRIRQGIKHSLLRTTKRKAGRSWELLVGYSLEELCSHLSSLFLPGMTWENHGRWHIDHIIPLSAWDYDGPDHPEFKAAWSLGNLRPLWAKDNLVKHTSLPTYEELQWLWGLK